MEGKGKIELPGKKEQVFKEMLDSELLEKCIMGCEELHVVSENIYKADLKVGIAAVKGKYEADSEVKNIDEQNYYTLVINGEGKPGLVDAEGNKYFEKNDI